MNERRITPGATIYDPWGKVSKLTIGFDDIVNKILDQNPNVSNYPPYNIRKLSETEYVIDVALAGFNPEEINVKTEGSSLTIAPAFKTVQEGEYIYQGIAKRDFVRSFTLTEHVEVDRAHFIHGILHIFLKKNLPDYKKPRKIEITEYRHSDTSEATLLTETTKKDKK